MRSEGGGGYLIVLHPICYNHSCTTRAVIADTNSACTIDATVVNPPFFNYTVDPTLLSTLSGTSSQFNAGPSAFGSGQSHGFTMGASCGLNANFTSSR